MKLQKKSYITDIMALVSMTDMLQKARENAYAVGAFNILDYNSMKAVVDAATGLNAPVIVQTSVKTVKHWGFRTMIAWIRELCEDVAIPVAIHLDHCRDVDFIGKCIDAGWTSVMIDASSLPFEENLAASKRVFDMAHPKGISVEAELGEIGGVEDDISVGDEDAHLVDVEKALHFLNEVPVDCFAPAIGTAHGVYKGKPQIAFDRLEAISGSSQVPLALHGGTGLSEEVFRKCIRLGCAKVNISTQLKYAFIDGFVNYHEGNPYEYNPLNELASQYMKVKEAVASNIRFFGSENRDL
jgi:ketose-bisphosphate aldolase